MLSVCLEGPGPLTYLPCTVGNIPLGRGFARLLANAAQGGRIRDGGRVGLEEGACCDWRRYLGSARNLSLLATAMDGWFYLQSRSSRTACGCRKRAAEDGIR